MEGDGGVVGDGSTVTAFRNAEAVGREESKAGEGSVEVGSSAGSGNGDLRGKLRDRLTYG